MTQTYCCDEFRRNAVREHPTLNGIDYLEVLDDESMPLNDRQRFLALTLLKAPAAALTADNVRIEGGEALRGIRVVDVQPASDGFTVEVDTPGDYSAYTLRLVANPSADDPPAGYDALLSAVVFSFKVNCPSDFDCASADDCPPQTFVEPELDYLARDFNSLRQMMLDRMRLLAPDWREDHLADFMQAMVDLKAYTADYQHYQLDAVNAEAYLFTARNRPSLRRHARLVDYRMHDGCSARVWAHFTIDLAISEGVPLPAQTLLSTRVPGMPRYIEKDTLAFRQLLEAGPEFFETLHAATLYSAHNTMCFYTWGDGRCWLARGATRATLAGHFPHLQKGDALILEEARGPVSGDPADADPAKRFAVRLVSVGLGEDTLTGQPVTEIEWHADDALPAPLCLSSDAPPPAQALPCGEAISVALGNIVLADHGRTLKSERLGVAPSSQLAYAGHRQPCADKTPDMVPPRFRPRLPSAGLSLAVPYFHEVSALAETPHAASAMLALQPSAALPAIALANSEDFSGALWRPQLDLLNSAPDKREFVVEFENDGSARLRFGDDEHGKRPNAGETFYARYRLGVGRAGNIGADTLGHLFENQPAIVGLRNPLAGAGGEAPEPVETVRQNAPQAFRMQERAVTPQDYEAVALRFPGIQRAAATIRWTGSWHTVFLTVDRAGGLPVTAEFEERLRSHLDAYRMMGYDLEVDAPLYAPLEIELDVCARPNYFRSEVRRALLEAFSARGLFHPDRFTFGQTVYLSQVYAAAETVPGVQSLAVTCFRVQDQAGRDGLASGQIPLARLEIAQLENDPNFPRRGVLRVTVNGGK